MSKNVECIDLVSDEESTINENVTETAPMDETPMEKQPEPICLSDDEGEENVHQEAETKEEIPDLEEFVKEGPCAPTIKSEHPVSEEEDEDQISEEVPVNPESDSDETEEDSSEPKEKLEKALKESADEDSGKKVKSKAKRSTPQTGYKSDNAAKIVICTFNADTLEALKNYKVTVPIMEKNIEAKKTSMKKLLTASEEMVDHLLHLFEKFQSLVHDKSELVVPCMSLIYSIVVFSGRVKTASNSVKTYLKSNVAFCELFAEYFCSIVASSGEIQQKIWKNYSPTSKKKSLLTEANTMEKLANEAFQKEAEANGTIVDVYAESDKLLWIRMGLVDDAFLYMVRIVLEYIKPWKKEADRIFLGRLCEKDGYKRNKANLFKEIGMECEVKQDSIPTEAKRFVDARLWKIFQRAYDVYVEEKVAAVVGTEKPYPFDDADYTSSSDNVAPVRNTKRKQLAPNKISKGRIFCDDDAQDDEGLIAKLTNPDYEHEQDPGSESEGDVYETTENAEKTSVTRAIKMEMKTTPVEKGSLGSVEKPIDVESLFSAYDVATLRETSVEMTDRGLRFVNLRGKKTLNVLKPLSKRGVVLADNTTIYRTGNFAHAKVFDQSGAIAELLENFFDQREPLIFFCVPELEMNADAMEAVYVNEFDKETFPNGIPKFITLSSFITTADGKKKFKDDLFIPTFLALVSMRLMKLGSRRLSDIHTDREGSAIYLFNLSDMDPHGDEETMIMSLGQVDQGNLYMPRKQNRCEYLLSDKKIAASDDGLKTIKGEIVFLNECLDYETNKKNLQDLVMQMQEYIGISINANEPVDLNKPFWADRKYAGDLPRDVSLSHDSIVAKCLFDYVLFEILGLEADEAQPTFEEIPLLDSEKNEAMTKPIETAKAEKRRREKEQDKEDNSEDEEPQTKKKFDDNRMEN